MALSNWFVSSSWLATEDDDNDVMVDVDDDDDNNCCGIDVVVFVGWYDWAEPDVDEKVDVVEADCGCDCWRWSCLSISLSDKCCKCSCCCCCCSGNLWDSIIVVSIATLAIS